MLELTFGLCENTAKSRASGAILASRIFHPGKNDNVHANAPFSPDDGMGKWYSK